MAEASPERAATDTPADRAGTFGVLQGDRLCRRCAFNLTGQPIVREPCYELLVVSCPHCRQVEPVQEYPLLGPWSQRWAMLAAALWLLGLVAFSVGSTLMIVGMTVGFTVQATNRMDRMVRSSYLEWGKLHLSEAELQLSWQSPRFEEFWAEQGGPLLAGPLIDRRRFIEWHEMAALLAPGAIALACGAFWSVVLLQWRRRSLVLPAFMLIMVIVLLTGVIWAWIRAVPPSSAEHVTFVHLRMALIALNVLAIGGLFIAGLLVGRPAIRGLVRALLPPRLRSSLAVLWTAEGLDPPTPSPTAWQRLGPGRPPEAGGR
jgi:hypothetical protein